MSMQAFAFPGISIVDDGAALSIHSSNQIKSELGRYYLRDKCVDLDMHREAETYKTERLLSYSRARGLLSLANQCAAVQRDEECQLLLSHQDKHTVQESFHLARRARDTLVAEENLAMANLKECQLVLIMLEDSVDESRVNIADADCQLTSVIYHLQSRKLSIPRAIVPSLRGRLPPSGSQIDEQTNRTPGNTGSRRAIFPSSRARLLRSSRKEQTSPIHGQTPLLQEN